MQFETNSWRTGAMARRIAIIALVALALGAGTFVLARGSLQQAATAELSFNPDAAYHDDIALTRTGQPAVAAAQSILTDTVLLDLLHKADAAVAEGPSTIDDLRSRLDVTEPGLETLQVRYRDPDPRRAAVVANAVATALAEDAPAAPSPAAHQPTVAATDETPQWENPFRILRLATVEPRLLAEPAWLATGISAFFFAAGVFGGLLFRHRALPLAHAEDAVEEERSYTLLPPEFLAQRIRGRDLVAPKPEPAQEARPSEPEVEWELGAREPEEVGEPVEPVPSAHGEPIEPVAAAALMTAAASASVDVQPAGIAPGSEKPACMEGGRISLLDPGPGDAVWTAQILLGFARTSIAQRLEDERPRDAGNHMPSRPSATDSDLVETRMPRGA